MYKILHISFTSQTIAGFVELINSNFYAEDHFFLTLGENQRIPDLLKHKNVQSIKNTVLPLRYSRLSSMIKKSEVTILHGLFDLPELMVLNRILLFGEPSPKLFWRIWGGELYDQFLVPPSGKLRMMKKLHRLLLFSMKKRIIKNLEGIIAPVQGDYDFAVSKYKTNAKLFLIDSYDYKDRSIFDQALTNSEGFSVPSILLGNSASITNEHFEALDILEEVKKISNIRVFCPLSYGDKDYAKRVIEYGKAKLGESFEPVLDFIKEEEYIKFLASVDVAIMNHRRQQGLGNISLLLKLGKKVYLRRETSTFRHFSDLGVKVFDIEDIVTNPEQTFIWSDIVAQRNREILFDYHGKERIIHAWKTVFDC